MSVEANKEIARRLYEEVVNYGKAELLETFVGDDGDDGDDGTRQRASRSIGRAGFREAHRRHQHQPRHLPRRPDRQLHRAAGPAHHPAPGRRRRRLSVTEETRHLAP
ncbi:hypothetical protein [Candidatus Frankia alpina]|uniref:hypothetical protein n=1 Tax=Candidatus Frankia alpina TaxID=2699483 RepID=UPI001F28DE60|nr:hypothetical protein [Candidatus Frankia alpina]